VACQGAGFQHFLDEPGANAMSHQEHVRLGTVRGEQLVEELNVRLYLRRQAHGRDIGEGAVTADVGRQAQVRVGEDGDGRAGLVVDRVQEGNVKVE
jgi:hypothetical protein